MEDFEIVRTDGEILKQTETILEKLKQEQEVQKKNMTQEMCVLIEEMDSLLKDKSDQERNYNATKRKMEKRLIDCQEIIDTLQKDLKASERQLQKARGDLRCAQDKCKQVEDKYTELQQNIENSKKESLQLTKKINELNQLVEQKNKKNTELEKLYTEERNKNDVNSYLKDYVEFLESEIQLEKKRKESIEFKDKVIQQLNQDHAAVVAELNEKIAEQLKEIESLKVTIQKKDQTIIEDLSTIMKQQIKINILNGSLSKPSQLAICQTDSNLNHSTNSSEISDQQSEVEQAAEEKDPNVDEEESISSQPYVLPSKKLVLINDPSSATNFISCMTGLEDQNQKLKKEIESWEKLFKTIDIDTYLIQIENQVDELHKKNIYESRNSILKKQLELTLRGIRQLCDYHYIDMEYKI
ncbi:hypothetical protein TTHERM_00312190 (macronuclear) [Tetrahymena thermophila SB210]|uniref:Uncharacterized protein n=1 Tax=Tetrahymena thermophila (strain SB210) TaxID=312017 RepID=Q22KR1_TETTS|nr:hypothetical protein TTHERM_00312190 [Tetrahymena thermophila SB210]EAR85738.1 hypothetical protein TTHERM_00312190 [Tetrahymena thermophila SB210]|eukprot:XP_001033401.1 hypothetical protein TTHERM_00312190 [Tetrahymena thermophila SB210]